MVKHVSLLYVGAYFGYMPRSGIAGTSGNIISSFLRNHQTDFRVFFTGLQSHQQQQKAWNTHDTTYRLYKAQEVGRPSVDVSVLFSSGSKIITGGRG